VLVFLFAAVFLVLGLVAIAAGLRAPAEKHDTAIGLIHIGFWLLGLALVVGGCYWFIVDSWTKKSSLDVLSAQQTMHEHCEVLISESQVRRN